MVYVKINGELVPIKSARISKIICLLVERQTLLEREKNLKLVFNCSGTKVRMDRTGFDDADEVLKNSLN